MISRIMGTPSGRIVLVGSHGPLKALNFHKDPDPFIFSEIVEFAMSMRSTPKGQEPFNGLPHLQAYRLIRAASLAELGHIALANRSAQYVQT